ncbi:MAG: 2-oxoacid:ferredoxin oxidoreductase subunit beta [Planctomycetes bacterium]|nr:2-oxoacid:ferredoxin oxidoreductase subunit beta [Planctomycetota bacterium]
MAEVGTVNRLGFNRQEYTGSPSTLCNGCGHDSITNHIITALYEIGADPYTFAKMSGIGCSSKTPAYFLSKSHGFNAVHGRMPSVSTGAKLANHELTMLAVSGDGDTASIGIGQFCHLIRRNVRMIYVIENNGVYGLTKGQFSATADTGSKQKDGTINELETIDCCELAITLGCTFVARSFSGDKKQMVPLLKAAMSHDGTALLDVISPCVTFNDHEGSSKSYAHVRETDTPLHEIGYVPSYEETVADYAEGSETDIRFPDGSTIRLKKLDHDYNPKNKVEAVAMLEESRKKGILTTGLIFVDTARKDFNATLHMVDTPLIRLSDAELRPSRETLSRIVESYR